MTTPIRKKRNFKALQLDVTQSPKPKEPEPISTRTALATAGVAKGKRRPPPMTLNAPKLGQTPVTNDTDGSLPAAGVGPPSAPAIGTTSARRNTYHTTLSNTLANLDMNAETRYDLRTEDLKDLQELGQGNGGSVKKVEHVPTKTIMAKKVSYSPLYSNLLTYCRWHAQIVLIDAKPSVRKQILRELHIMHDCNSPYIISFYGAFLSDPNICICMEFMDKGSLDGIYKKIGAIDIDVVGHVALAVLEGLTYLYDVHRIIHRGIPTNSLTIVLADAQTLDIKPSNILCNSQGQIKICDFGVSGELINSIADTFVGTSTYMSVCPPFCTIASSL